MNEDQMKKQLEKILEELKKLTRRTENIEKTQNIQHQDRGILEDILLKHDQVKGELANMKLEMGLMKDKIQSLEKNTRADIANVQNKVEDKVDELKKGGE